MITKLGSEDGCLGSLLVRFMREKWACGDIGVEVSVGNGIVLKVTLVTGHGQ